VKRGPVRARAGRFGRWAALLLCAGAVPVAAWLAIADSSAPPPGPPPSPPREAAAAAAPHSAATPPASVAPDDGDPLARPPHGQWRTWTTRDGLPSNQVFAVRADGPRVWAGTAAGLALFEGDRWRTFGTDDGLPHRMVLSVDVSPRTGDVWIGTVGGMARLSGGRIDSWTQTDSGLPNDFVHAVRCDPDEDTVWAATAMGAGRLDLRTGSWSLYTHENTPMHEPWTYSVAAGEGKVFVGAWGGGVLELTRATGRWREYKDPDGQFEVDLFPDDGPINDVTSGVDYAAGLLWQSAYFGLSRYDGREWRTYIAATSGLAGDFVNFIRAQGRAVWAATDQGLTLTDGYGWVTYRRLEDGRGAATFFDGSRKIGRRILGGAPPHNYILGVDAAGDAVWVATEAGVGRGLRGGGGPAPRPAGSRPAVVDGDRSAAADDAFGAAAAGPAPAGETARPDGQVRFHYANVPEALLPFREATPHQDLFIERSQFRGSGRDDPDPLFADGVPIGFIGPLEDADLPPGAARGRPGATGDPKAAIGRRMLRAATLAIEEANAAGGYRGTPFRLAARTDLVLWGQSSNELVRFVIDQDVRAVLSSLDSNHNHVLSRAALKLEVPLVSAGSTDPTLVEHAIPWLVRCINDDRQASYALLQEMFGRRGLRRPAVLRVNDRDGRTGIMEFTEGARRLGHPVALEQRFLPGTADFGALIDRIREVEPDSLVVWGDAGDAGRAVQQARAAGIAVPIFGCSRMHQTDFLEIAGGAAEGAVLVAVINPESADPAWVRFRDAYRARWGADPDMYAAHAYDGMNLIVGAIRRAGPNRARVRDALFELGTVRGATGTIVFDTNMSDIGPIWLATVRGGRFVHAPAPAWPDPGKGK
jgi:ABC-type branched-subunit amino acid transport system substrate-binding protein